MNIKFNHTGHACAMGHGSLLRLGPAMAHFLKKEKPKLSALVDTAIKPMDLDAKFDGSGGLGERDESSEPFLMQSTTTVQEDHGGMSECGGNDVVSNKAVAFGNIVKEKEHGGMDEYGGNDVVFTKVVATEGAGGCGEGGDGCLKGLERNDRVAIVSVSHTCTSSRHLFMMFLSLSCFYPFHA